MSELLPKICAAQGYKSVQAWQQDCLDTLIHNYQQEGGGEDVPAGNTAAAAD